MELTAPFFSIGGHFAIDLPGARAVFSTRRGGHSRGPYASLNLGRHTDDDATCVTRNRVTLADAIGAQSLSFTHQVHGAEIHYIAAPPAADAPEPDADGQVTDRHGVAPVALTADCLPVAIATDGAVAMLHAGWRGLAGGVLAAGVQALRQLGADGELHAAIGPGAGPCCYEAGDEVHAAFDDVPGARVGGNVDLKRVAADRLLRAGVAHVHDIGMCTICAPVELLFSHRRDRGITGRQAGVAWLT